MYGSESALSGKYCCTERLESHGVESLKSYPAVQQQLLNTKRAEDNKMFLSTVVGRKYSKR